MRRYAILYSSETEKYSTIFTDGEYDSEGNALWYIERNAVKNLYFYYVRQFILYGIPIPQEFQS